MQYGIYKMVLSVSSIYRANFRQNYCDRPRRQTYKIKLMLWRVSWALAQISCLTLLWGQVLDLGLEALEGQVPVNNTAKN